MTAKPWQSGKERRALLIELLRPAVNEGCADMSFIKFNIRFQVELAGQQTHLRQTRTERCMNAVKWFYAVEGGEPLTLKEIGERIGGVSGPRAAELRDRGVRILKHPSFKQALAAWEKEKARV